MRRRDRNLWLAYAVSLALQAASVACVAYLSVARARTHSRALCCLADRISELEARPPSVVVQDCASKPADLDGDAPPSLEPVPVRVLGFGQSKTTRRRYIYRDTLWSDGSTRRDIVQWLPLKADERSEDETVSAPTSEASQKPPVKTP